MKNKWLWIIIAVVIIILIGIAFILKQVNGGGSHDDDSNKGYDTYKVKHEQPLHLEGKASPKSVKTYTNNSQIGDFSSVQVKDGQKVQQGDPLISYDTNQGKRQELADKVDDQQSVVNEDYQKVNQEPNNNDLQKKLNQDQNALSQAQQQLSKHDKQVNNSTYASFDGKVDIKNKNDASDGQPILKLISTEPQLKATVSEFDLDKIKKGDSVNVKIGNNGKTGKGEITKISELPTSYDKSGGQGSGSNPVDNDPSGGSSDSASKYSVTIGNIDIPVRAGFSMQADVPLKSMKLPESVLTKDDKVFVVDSKDKVHKKDIKINKNNGEIFVKKGLEPGDQLLKHPKKTLNDGEKVEVSS
ncbi:HlyD family efflux transporter periplasmic adaptor subunit [Staphylococcus sp. SQ8-PEA]|uniref:HlyD family efflux transporter periplasmic adaptor subunit n=1 Tax=Staphylococcus marylandisciuri TaxID=2981529 RepID=A0ABT2QRR8_9STAP|nr:HlyD family efflux transporter periplasmic adaptor subunit [Staphylococcus marylandisciuri]MCU5746665.1 HlyD family efflux transporter periplasmic adaptor subunit [Staphylococcus marylandisciuri]